MDGRKDGQTDGHNTDKGPESGVRAAFLAGPEHMAGTVSPPFHGPPCAVLLVSAGLVAVGRTGWRVTVSPSPGSPLFLGENMCHEQGGKRGPSLGKTPKQWGLGMAQGCPQIEAA